MADRAGSALAARAGAGLPGAFTGGAGAVVITDWLCQEFWHCCCELACEARRQCGCCRTVLEKRVCGAAARDLTQCMVATWRFVAVPDEHACGNFPLCRAFVRGCRCAAGGDLGEVQTPGLPCDALFRGSDVFDAPSRAAIRTQGAIGETPSDPAP